MRYSIITPTLVRPSLLKTIESINGQTNGDWEHLIAVDVPLVMYPGKREFIASIPKDPRRQFIRCGKAHKNYGNTCRYNMCDRAKGDYILYLDDDDVYADNKVFETLECVTEPWAIFPCLRVGVPWLVEPPGLNKTGSGMFMHRRGIVKYHDPQQPGYAEFLKSIDGGKFYADLVAWCPMVKERLGEVGNMWIKYAADGFTVEELKAKYPYQVVRGRPLTIYECANKGRE